MLVLGAPLSDHNGRLALGGIFGSLLRQAKDRLVLIVRSHYLFTSNIARLTIASRAQMVEETI